VGNLLGSPIGALTLLIINELIRAAGVQSNFQPIVSGLMLYIFIVLQSVVVWLRSGEKFKLALPSWLMLFKNEKKN
jgi:ribose/xylose/arabinose/galactoside ABC-type transport system permease subunit